MNLPEDFKWREDRHDDLTGGGVGHFELGQGEGESPAEPQDKVLNNAEVVVVLKNYQYYASLYFKSSSNK